MVVKSPSEIVDYVQRLVDARVRVDRTRMIYLIHDLLRGPVEDALNVTLILAGVLAEGGDGEEPEDGFHRVTVVRELEDGTEVPGDVNTLPPHVATFARMVTAVLNDDRDMARDLWLGYVGDDGHRALPLLIFALEEVVHSESGCPCQDTIR